MYYFDPIHGEVVTYGDAGCKVVGRPFGESFAGQQKGLEFWRGHSTVRAKVWRL